MDITFWVIQAVLLTPVLFLAASVGMEEQPGRSRHVATLRPEAEQTSRSPVATARAGLSQFSAAQQARLVMLRSIVQRGALSDDMVAAPDSPERQRRLNGRQLLLVGGVLLIAVGVVGVVRTNLAIDDLQRTTTSRVQPLSPAARLLPSLLVNPAKYLSAVNGSSASANSVDPLYAASVMEQKQAMDRWEAFVGIGLSLLLFLSSTESSVASDVAPFVLVAAALFAGLSFFELP